METEKYEHHGVKVSAISELKGKHRDICLCWNCALFSPGNANGQPNCSLAQMNFEMDVKFHLITPVIECQIYVPLEQETL